MNVLVVDDNEINRKLLRVSLEAAGMSVTQAADGLEALDALGHAQFDVVLSDILMPRMGGYRLCHEIRETPRLADLPFIIYTATYLTPSDEQTALDLGADLFLRKPASTDALVTALQDVTRSRSRSSAARPRRKPEIELMKEYSERLVAKLEDTYVRLQDRSEELRAAHDQMRRLLAHSPAVIYTLRIEGDNVTPIFVSDNIQQLSGLGTSASTHFEWWRDSLHPEDRDRVLAALRRGLAEGGYSMTYRIRHRDGTYRWVEDQNRVLRDAADRPVEAFGVWTDITERRQAEQAIRRLGDLVESSNDAIIGETLDATITSWNPAATEIFGYSAAEMIGRSLETLIPPDRAEEEADLLARVRRGDRILNYETRRVRKDGRSIDVSVTVSPIRDGNDRIVGASKIARDITARKQAEQLRASISLTLSHELNTPLNGIIGATELIQADAETMPAAELREFVDMIRRSGDRLRRLVSRNLDYAQLEILGIGRELPAGDRAATAVTQPIIETLAKAIARDHGRLTDLELDVDEGAVRLAPHWLIRLATELLDNAFKFSARGSPVQVTGRYDAGRFQLCVRDAGRGMTSEQIASINPFVQFDRPRYAQQGVGLGLYLAQRIAELHGGRLIVASAVGEGTTVTAELRSSE